MNTQTLLEYLVALAELLPAGPIWSIDKDERLYAFCLALVSEPTRLDEQLRKLVTETNPLTADELVPEWEAVFGLPDDCAPPPSTQEGRQAAIAAAFLGRGGATTVYFLHVLKTVFGIDGSIEEWTRTPWIWGPAPRASFWGDGSGTDGGGAWWSYSDFFTWQLTLPEPDVETKNRIECLFNRIKPAHTTVIYNYT